MSVTYTDDHNEALREETFVPVYARTRTSRTRKKGVRTWMILAPVGLLVIGGAAAATMTMNRGEPAAPLAEPAVTAPVIPETPMPMTAPTAESMAPMAPVDAAPAPVEREAAPAPVRREATARRAAPRVEAAPPAPAPAPSVPIQSSPSTTTLNTAPAQANPAPVAIPTPPPPVIPVEPLN